MLRKTWLFDLNEQNCQFVEGYVLVLFSHGENLTHLEFSFLQISSMSNFAWLWYFVLPINVTFDDLLFQGHSSIKQLKLRLVFLCEFKFCLCVTNFVEIISY